MHAVLWILLQECPSWGFIFTCLEYLRNYIHDKRSSALQSGWALLWAWGPVWEKPSCALSQNPLCWWLIIGWDPAACPHKILFPCWSSFPLLHILGVCSSFLSNTYFIVYQHTCTHLRTCATPPHTHMHIHTYPPTSAFTHSPKETPEYYQFIPIIA